VRSERAFKKRYKESRESLEPNTRVNAKLFKNKKRARLKAAIQPQPRQLLSSIWSSIILLRGLLKQKMLERKTERQKLLRWKLLRRFKRDY